MNQCERCSNGHIFTNEKLSVIAVDDVPEFDRSGCHYTNYGNGIYGCRACDNVCSIISKIGHAKYSDQFEGPEDGVPLKSIKYGITRHNKIDSKRIANTIGTEKHIRVWLYCATEKKMIFEAYYTMQQRINQKERKRYVTLVRVEGD